MMKFYLIMGVILSFSLKAFPAVSDQACSEDIILLHAEFLSGNFDEGRSTVGRDQVEPVRERILNFLKSTPDSVITSVKVTSSSARVPFYIHSEGKKKIDPKSEERNLSLAKERATFFEKAIAEAKSSHAFLEKIQFEVSAQLGGPEFQPLDLNDRFVTKMTPGYQQRVGALFKKFEKQYTDHALKASPADLMDEKQYSNLFQAKFRPFQGYRIEISGFKKAKSKCSDFTQLEKDSKVKASKQ